MLDLDRPTIELKSLVEATLFVVGLADVVQHRGEIRMTRLERLLEDLQRLRVVGQRGRIVARAQARVAHVEERRADISVIRRQRLAEHVQRLFEVSHGLVGPLAPFVHDHADVEQRFGHVRVTERERLSENVQRLVKRLQRFVVLALVEVDETDVVERAAHRRIDRLRFVVDALLYLQRSLVVRQRLCVLSLLIVGQADVVEEQRDRWMIGRQRLLVDLQRLHVVMHGGRVLVPLQV